MVTPRLTACIVTYHTPEDELARVVESLKHSAVPVDVVVVENSPTRHCEEQAKRSNEAIQVLSSGTHWIASASPRNDDEGAVSIQSPTNLGFGGGQNLGFQEAGKDSDYFLCVNPDIVVHDGAIEAMVEYMQTHPDIGLIAPRIVDENGELFYGCRRYPTVLALFGRRFLPGFLQRLPVIKQRLDAYLMKNADYNTMLEPEFISGCFMMFRTSTFKKIGGFDERFFLYFEDTDITLRVRESARAVYYPQATVTHVWKGGAKNSLKLTLIMIKSAVKFFNKRGWKWW